MSEEPDLIVQGLRGQLKDDGVMQPINALQLMDDTRQQFVFDVYSLNFDKGTPSSEAGYTIFDTAYMTSSILSRAVQIVQTTGELPDISSPDIQLAIWSITDGVNQADLAGRGYQANIENIRSVFDAAGLSTANIRLLEDAPVTSAEEYLERGIRYLASEEYVQAIADFDQAIELAAELPRGYISRAYAHILRQDFPKAINDLSAATLIEQESAEAYLMLGITQYVGVQSTESALDNLTQAIELEPVNLEPDHIPANLLAIICANCEESLAVTTHAAAYYFRGLVHLNRQEFDQAVQDLTSVIKYEPRYADAYFTRGQLYASQNDLESALADFSQAIAQYPEYVDAIYARGALYHAHQEYRKAIADFDRILEITPGSVSAYRARGISYYASEEYEKALPDLLQYVKLNPSAILDPEIGDLLMWLREPSSGPSDSAIDLIDAIRDKLVQVEISSFGVASGDSLLLKIQRLTPRNMEVFVPKGLLLVREGSSQPAMIVRQLSGILEDEGLYRPALSIQLDSDEIYTYLLEAYSTDFDVDTPTQGTIFTIRLDSKSDAAQILDATERLFGAGGEVTAVQTAIWVATDDISWLEISQKGYRPDLLLTHRILRASGIETDCSRLLGGPNCSLADEATEAPEDLNASQFNQLGVESLAGGDVETAISQFSTAIDIDPSLTLAYFNRGEAYRRQKDFTRAVADFRQAIALDPADVDAYEYLALTQYQQGNYEASLTTYTRAIELDSNNAEYYLGRGMAHADLGNKDDAFGDYRRALELDANLALAYYYRGKLYLEDNDLANAVADFTQAISLDPEDEYALNERGIAYARQGDLENATRDYSTAIVLNPRYATPYNNRGYLKYEAGDYEGAIADYTQAIEMGLTNASVYVNRGLALARQGNFERAIDDLTEAISIHPQSAGAHIVRGIIYEKQNEFELALADYFRATEIVPNDADPYYYIGEIYLRLENRERATEYFSRATEIEPENVKFRTSLCQLTDC